MSCDTSIARQNRFLLRIFGTFPASLFHASRHRLHPSKNPGDRFVNSWKKSLPPPCFAWTISTFLGARMKTAVEIAAAAGKKDRGIIFRMVATGISRRLGWPDMRAEDMSL
jgi:hypothetical protein